MKQYLIILFLLSIGTYSYAQDWAPVRAGEVYHYTNNYLNTAPSPSFDLLPQNFFISIPNPITNNEEFSIAIRDSTLIGGDANYEYRRRFQQCYTCSFLGLSEVYQGTGGYYFPNIVKKGTGGYLIIYNYDTLFLPNNPLTISSYNQQYNMSVLSTTVVDSIYGTTQDSTIYIDILANSSNTYYNIGISKNYGIVFFRTPYTDITSIGKEGTMEGGYTSLQFEDIYDFNVGDQFYYHKYVYRGSGVSSWGYPTNVLEFWYRWKILNRQDVGADTIHYTIERVYYGQGYPVFQNLGVADTFNKTYIHSEDSFYTMMNNELRFRSHYCRTSGCEMLGCKNLFSITGNHMKYIGYDFNLTAQQMGPLWSIDNYVSIFRENSLNMYEGEFISLHDLSILYHKGLGSIYKGEWYFESTDIRELLGYIKGTDTVGSTPNITIYTDIKDPLEAEYNIKLLRNPTSDYLKVHYQNQQTKHKLRFSIMDAMGRILATYEEPDLTDEIYIFPVQNLAKGIYFLEVRQDEILLEAKQFIKK